jgi:hypothetical protein
MVAFDVVSIAFTHALFKRLFACARNMHERNFLVAFHSLIE